MKPSFVLNLSLFGFLYLLTKTIDRVHKKVISNLVRKLGSIQRVDT